jgi:hypothetical protein
MNCACENRETRLKNDLLPKVSTEATISIQITLDP